MKIEFDIFNREFFKTLTFSLKFQKKAQVSIIYMKNIVFLLPSKCYGVKPVIQPIRAKNKSSPFKRKKFLSLCCIVTNTEWNGIIKLIIEVKCIRIILSPNLIDLVVF